MKKCKPFWELNLNPIIMKPNEKMIDMIKVNNWFRRHKEYDSKNMSDGEKNIIFLRNKSKRIKK